MPRFYAVTAVLLLATLAHAQLPQYHAQVFGAEEGISGGAILDVFKDRQQFMWIVATNIVQRFDGRNVQRHTFPAAVSQVICDADNRVWVMAGRRLWRDRADWPGVRRNSRGHELGGAPRDLPAGRSSAGPGMPGRPLRNASDG